MREKEYTLIGIIRDPGTGIYETFELEREGHYYVYRYDAAEETFYRATVPAGAARTQFFPLPAGGQVPISGWKRVGGKPRPEQQLLLISHHNT